MNESLSYSFKAVNRQIIDDYLQFIYTKKNTTVKLISIYILGIWYTHYTFYSNALQYVGWSGLFTFLSNKVLF